MTDLPSVRSDQVIRALQKAGYAIDHQKGSHAVLYKVGRLPITVPRHNRDLKKGTLHTILRGAGLSVDEFVRLL